MLVREDTVAEAVVAGGPLTAESALPAAELPLGVYRVRATVGSGDSATVLTRRLKLGEGQRRVMARADAPTVSPDASTGRLPADPPPAVGSASAARLAVAPFNLDEVLAPSFVTAALSRAGSHADAEVRDQLTEQMQNGIEKLRGRDPGGAASDFRVRRLAPDYRPALAYLGACYAAGGAHQRAAGAWQTAVLADRDNADMHALAIDGWMRADRFGSALALAEQAATRWPDEVRFKRHLASALLATGQPAQAIDAVLAMGEAASADDPLLAAVMLQLYRNAQTRTPLFDEAKDLEVMRTLRSRYPAAGPRGKLVDLWLSDMER